MDKALVQRMLIENPVNLTDLGNFISQYTYDKLGRHITAEELSGILHLIRMNIFDLRYALVQAAEKLGLYVMNAFDKNGMLIKTYVYE